jgi:plastocyanin
MAMVALLAILPACSGASGVERSGTSAPAPAAAGATVTVSNFQFTPAQISIRAGAEVTWKIKEGTHTIDADNGEFSSGALSANQTFTHKFTKAGTYLYYCSFHGSKGGHDMAGTIVVH